MTKAQYKNPVKAVGHAQMPHVMTRDAEISDGAFRTFAVIVEHAQQKDHAWPSRETIADAIKKSTRMVDRYMVELIDAGYIERKQRRDKTAMTYILDFEQQERLQNLALDILAARSKKDTHVEDKQGMNDTHVESETDTDGEGRRTNRKKTTIKEEEQSNDNGHQETKDLLISLGITNPKRKEILDKHYPHEHVAQMVTEWNASGERVNLLIYNLTEGAKPSVKEDGEHTQEILDKYTKGEFAGFIEQ